MSSIFSYRVCNSVLRSNVPLPELLPNAGETPAECSFSLVSGRGPSLSSIEWYQHWPSANGQIWLVFGRIGSEYLLRFPGIACFSISANFAEIQCFPEPGARADTIRHLFLDQVLPLIVSSRGYLVLHASAVITPVGGIAFLGATGQGKSTLAASFSKEGCPFLTDDCLVLNKEGSRFLAVPSYPSLRLWPESVFAMSRNPSDYSQVADYSTKKRLRADDQFSFYTEVAMIKRFYILSNNPSGVVIEPLRPREVIPEMVKFLFVIDVNDRTQMKEKFEALSAIAGHCPCYRLAFPRDFSLLSQLRQSILSHVST